MVRAQARHTALLPRGAPARLVCSMPLICPQHAKAAQLCRKPAPGDTEPMRREGGSQAPHSLPPCKPSCGTPRRCAAARLPPRKAARRCRRLHATPVLLACYSARTILHVGAARSRLFWGRVLRSLPSQHGPSSVCLLCNATILEIDHRTRGKERRRRIQPCKPNLGACRAGNAQAGAASSRARSVCCLAAAAPGGRAAPSSHLAGGLACRWHSCDPVPASLVGGLFPPSTHRHCQHTT